MKKIVGIALAALMVLAMAACKDEVATGTPKLRGEVFIPAEIMMGMDVIADIDAVFGSGDTDYQWEACDTADGDYYELVGATGDFFKAEGEGIVEGYYLRVKITRSNRVGELYSNAGKIYPAAFFETVTIGGDGSLVNEGNVLPNETRVVKAKVTHDGIDPDIFQAVYWSVSGTTANSGTTIDKKGNLKVGKGETGIFYVTATSIYDDTVSDTITLVVGAISSSLMLEIERVAIIDRITNPPTNPANNGAAMNNGDDNCGPIGTHATLGSNGYFFENMKVPEGTADARNELYFYLAAPVVASNYNYLSYDIAGDNLNIINFDGHYPRFIKQDPEPAVYTQLMVNTAWRAVVNPLVDNFEVKWCKMVIPLNDKGLIHENPTNWDTVKGGLDVVALRFINSGAGSGRTPVAGKVYIRNLQLHINHP